MRILGLDFETTGLDTSKDRITEMGAVLWDVPTKKPLLTMGSYLYSPDYPPITPENEALTGISESHLKEFGYYPAGALVGLSELARKHGVSYVVAHNGAGFDRPILEAELKRAGVDDLSTSILQLPWLDTRHDLPHSVEPQSNRLRHLALDAGFINPFEHRAVFDVLTMLKVLSQFEFDKIVEYSKIPWLVVRALVDYNDRQLAKDKRYSWERLGEKTYPKMWVKRLKENMLAEERKSSTFPIGILEGGE